MLENFTTPKTGCYEFCNVSKIENHYGILIALEIFLKLKIANLFYETFYRGDNYYSVLN